jgi:hypothetical protein
MTLLHCALSVQVSFDHAFHLYGQGRLVLAQLLYAGECELSPKISGKLGTLGNE